MERCRSRLRGEVKREQVRNDGSRGWGWVGLGLVKVDIDQKFGHLKLSVDK